MKQIKTIRNLLTIAMLVLWTGMFYAQKIELESLNIINSDLRVEGGNLIIKENASITLNSKIIITGGNKDEYKVKIVFSGVDENSKEVAASAEYTYSKKSNTNGNNLSLKLPPHSRLRISSVAHFVDDWQGETAYFSVNKRSPKTNFAILLNGIAKPLNNGVCKFGRCFCIEGSQGSDCDNAKKIEFGSMLISQTIRKNKENDYTWTMTTGFTQNANNRNIPSLDQLVAWGELEAFITAELVDAKGNKETIKVPCDLSAEKGICLFNGQKNMVSPSGVTLTSTICHFRTAPGAQFGISSTSIYLRNKTAYQKPSSDNFTWTETWVADNKTNICGAPELENVFLNEVVTADNFAVVLGLNNTKKEPSDLELAMSNGTIKLTGRYIWTESHDKRTIIEVQPSVDSNGNWTFKGFKPKEFNIKTTSFSGFEISAYSTCHTGFKFVSVYKRKLADKKDWDYKVTMKNTIAYDNPVFVSMNGGLTNILALSAPSSGINVSGGSIALSDNAKFDFTISNGSAGNGDLDFKKINAGSVSIQFAAKGDGRVFWHWSFPVTTTNPRIAINTDSLKLKDYTIRNIEIRLINDRNDTIIYEYDKDYAYSLDGKETFLFLEKSDKIRYYDPCKTKYKLKEIECVASNVSNLYSLQFKFNLEEKSDVPEDIELVVELKNCEGTAQYIKIALKYDAKSETYIGSQTIQQIQNCRWELKAGFISAYNSCKDKTVWTFDTSKGKDRGGRAIALDLLIRADDSRP